MSQKKDQKTGKWYYYGAYIDKDGIKHQYNKRGFKSQREVRKAEDVYESVAVSVENTCFRILGNWWASIINAKREVY